MNLTGTFVTSKPDARSVQKSATMCQILHTGPFTKKTEKGRFEDKRRAKNGQNLHCWREKRVLVSFFAVRFIVGVCFIDSFIVCLLDLSIVVENRQYWRFFELHTIFGAIFRYCSEKC